MLKRRALQQRGFQVAGLDRGVHPPEDCLHAVARVIGGLDLHHRLGAREHVAHEAAGFIGVMGLDGLLRRLGELDLERAQGGKPSVFVECQLRHGQLGAGQRLDRRKLRREGPPIGDGALQIRQGKRQRGRARIGLPFGLRARQRINLALRGRQALLQGRGLRGDLGAHRFPAFVRRLGCCSRPCTF